MVDQEDCRLCGGPLTNGVCPNCSNQQAYRVLHKDILLLVLLSTVAVGLFLATKAFARRERDMERREAAIWYERGRTQSNSGNTEEAVESYRRALAGDRDNRTFALSLANALARGKHPDEARQAMLRLRESDPEDAEINLALARLEANVDQIADAEHFYQDALYGRWKGTQVDERRREVRVELVRFLLKHGEKSPALSELDILGSDLPDNAATRIQLAQLFLAAGDPQNALKYFDEALRLEPQNSEVLTEAGEIAFRMGNYQKARHYLESSVAHGDESISTRSSLSLIQSILSLDPLQPRLTIEERRLRLLRGIDYALSRTASCLESNSRNDQESDLRSLQADASKLQRTLHGPHPLPNANEVRSDFDLIYRIEEAVNATCGDASGPDLALALIWHSHSGAQ
jgi:tetratricopeptide (TPR) repeat protein